MTTHKAIMGVREAASKAAELYADTENRLLREYVDAHRKYPNGYAFTLDGHDVAISCAMGAVGDNGIEIAYGLTRNGEPYDTLMEKNVNHPDYA